MRKKGATLISYRLPGLKFNYIKCVKCKDWGQRDLELDIKSDFFGSTEKTTIPLVQF